MIDTITVNGVKSLFLISNNFHSFSFAIYHIDLKTGRRLPGSLCRSGHVTDAIIKDINGDSKKDIRAVGYEDSY